MFHPCGWPELVPDSGMQTGNFFPLMLFSQCLWGRGGVRWGSLELRACQGAKAPRPVGKHVQRQIQNGPKLPPSRCDCFLLHRYPRSLVNSHIRPLCFQTCPRSQGRQQWSSPSLDQATAESEHKGRMDHWSASWTKGSLLRQQDRYGLPRVSDSHPGPLWTPLRTSSLEAASVSV